jgi:hypothetical protein
MCCGWLALTRAYRQSQRKDQAKPASSETPKQRFIRTALLSFASATSHTTHTVRHLVQACNKLKLAQLEIEPSVLSSDPV